MVEWLAGNRIRGTNLERAGASVAQATPTKIIDGNYTVLTYTADGKFIPKNSFNVEYLVVGGGGSGGLGGGGAGGYRTNFGGTALGVTAQSYPITVGAGGVQTGGYDGSNNGSDSIFDTITSTGGGYGGRNYAQGNNGANGGSGGGGGSNNSTNTDPTGGISSPVTSPVQGYAGGGGIGTANGYPNISAGGGGGSSSIGGSGSGNTAGNGGSGTSSSITGSAVIRAGGGGGFGVNGGAGGSGGGGSYSGGGSGIGGAGAANTGSGGGGTSSTTDASGSGGSGIVILRFLTSGNTYDVEEIGLMQSLASGSVGGWHEVGRTTLGSGNANITVSSLADKRYYMVLGDYRSSSAINVNGRLGNGSIDTTTTYSERQSTNGGTDSPLTSQPSAPQFGTLSGNTGFGVEYIANKSDKEKLGITNAVKQNTTGAGYAPDRFQSAWKWSNTSNPLDVVERRTSVNTYNANSEVVVLGWDPADTHTTNFWEELASANATGSELSSGTFTAKKYLWVQYFIKPTGGTVNGKIHLNDDTGNNYADRLGYEGGESTHNPHGNWFGYARGDGSTTHSAHLFCNMFIINNSSNEKLAIQHIVDTTTGAGSAPKRTEWVNKWVPTTNQQITKIDIDRDNGTGTYDSTSFIKVWGSN